LKHWDAGAEKWVAQAQAGDLAAFEALVGFYQGRILRLCQRLLGGSVESQDVAQETFVSAYVNLAKLDPARPPGAWLTTVAGRLCLNRLRSQKKLLFGVEEEPVEAGLDESWLAREDQERLQAAILLLPAQFRAVIVLYYLEEWNCRDIGEALGMSESNVKVSLHRGREKLRKLLCP
jgi:RNA polymerase sigma-70 factor (ECF subfamily)